MIIPTQKAEFTGLAKRNNCQNYRVGKKGQITLSATAKKVAKRAYI